MELFRHPFSRIFGTEFFFLLKESSVLEPNTHIEEKSDLSDSNPSFIFYFLKQKKEQNDIFERSVNIDIMSIMNQL